MGSLLEGDVVYGTYPTPVSRDSQEDGLVILCPSPLQLVLIGNSAGPIWAMMSGFSWSPQRSQDDQHHPPRQPPLPALLVQHSIPRKGKV